MLVSNAVTAREAVWFDGSDFAAAQVRVLAGGAGSPPGMPLVVRGANGEWETVRPGMYVVDYGDGDVPDLAVMSGKEYSRWFGQGTQ